jgi:hypothetical protein
LTHPLPMVCLRFTGIDMTVNKSKVLKELALWLKCFFWKVNKQAICTLYLNLSSYKKGANWIWTWLQTVKDSVYCGWLSNLVVKRVDSDIQWSQFKSSYALTWSDYLEAVALTNQVSFYLFLDEIFIVPAYNWGQNSSWKPPLWSSHDLKG